MNLLGKVRRLYYREGLTLSEIERCTGLTRKTIRKWLKAPEGVEPKYRRKVGDTKIAPYAAQLVTRVRQLRSQVLVFARAHFQKCHYNSANCSGAAGFPIPSA